VKIMEKRYICEGTLVHEEAVQAVHAQMLSDSLFSASANFFKVMGDNTRFRILFALDKHELCVCDLANLLGMSVSAVSHQLARLRDNKLVKSRRDGKNIFYSLADEHVSQMLTGCVEHAMEEMV
jgi:ArsR family transcriptional regulator